MAPQTNIHSQACIKGSQLRQRQNWHYKTGDFLKEVQFIWIFLWQDKKKLSLNTGDCFIEVTTLAGLTVHYRLISLLRTSEFKLHEPKLIFYVWLVYSQNQLYLKTLSAFRQLSHERFINTESNIFIHGMTLSQEIIL